MGALNSDGRVAASGARQEDLEAGREWAQSELELASRSEGQLDRDQLLGVGAINLAEAMRVVKDSFRTQNESRRTQEEFPRSRKEILQAAREVADAWQKLLESQEKLGGDRELSTRISRPPGHFLRMFGEFFYSKKTFAEILEPTIADLREEYNDALIEGREWKARWVRVRGYWSFVSAAGLTSTVGLGKKLVKLWRLVT